MAAPAVLVTALTWVAELIPRAIRLVRDLRKKKAEADAAHIDGVVSRIEADRSRGGPPNAGGSG